MSEWTDISDFCTNSALVDAVNGIGEFLLVSYFCTVILSLMVRAGLQKNLI